LQKVLDTVLGCGYDVTVVMNDIPTTGAYAMIKVTKFDTGGKVLASTSVATVEAARKFLDKLDSYGNLKLVQRAVVSLPLVEPEHFEGETAEDRVLLGTNTADRARHA